jgi:hypothetical protein
MSSIPRCQVRKCQNFFEKDKVSTKVAGKPSANYLCTAPCQADGISLGFGVKADLRSW